MSIAKVHAVGKARKAQGKCRKCGTEINPGDGYRYWMPFFRSNTKYVVCMSQDCTPPYSELESGKAATIYAAQESFEASIDSLGEKDEIESAVAEVAEAVEEVREEYQTAADAWEHGNEQLQEKADHYEAQHDEIRDWEFDGADEWDMCEAHEEADADRDDDEVAECEDCQFSKEEWLEEIREAAKDKVNSIEIQ